MLEFLEDEWTMHATTENYSLYHLKADASSDAFTHTHIKRALSITGDYPDENLSE